MSLMFTLGQLDAARVALNRSLAIAEERGDLLVQPRLLGTLHMFHNRIGDRKTAMRYVKRMAAVSRTIEDPAALALARSLLGMSLHHTGDLSGARVELEAAVQHGGGSPRSRAIYLGFESQSLAGSALARTLWLQGYPAQALERTRWTVRDAASADHPVTLSVALIWAISVFLWTGDLRSAEEHIDWLTSRVESYALGAWLAVGRGYKGELALRRGEARGGIESLRACLEGLRAARHDQLTTAFSISLAQGLATTGRFAEGMTLVDEAIRQVDANGDLTYMPELLRAKGGLLLSMPQPNDDDAEACFMQSLEFSRRQAARAWELRTAVDFAALLAARGQTARARALLQPVFEQFVEGLDTADLQAAERLLATLS
jgi:tetratricopeptide (TPR) repeat protein